MPQIIMDFPWIDLCKLLLGAFICQLFIQKVFKSFLIKQMGMNKKESKLKKLYRYDAIFVIALSSHLISPFLSFSEKWLSNIRSVTYVVAIFSGIFVISLLIEIIGNIFIQKAKKTETAIDDILIPLVQRVLKVVIFTFGGVFIASNLGANITSLLTGLGIGGIAIAMAAKNTIENLLGSITILFDQPFTLGDWIEIDGVEGTVESIGLRSTRVRTFYSSQISIPNSFLINTKIDNYGRRKYRRIKTILSVTYDTSPERIESFCEGIREIIRKHPYTRKDYYHVYFNQFSSSSLDILLYCFLSVKDWSVELRERQSLFLDIMRLANRLEVKFAYPTQSIELLKPEDINSPELETSFDDISKAREQGKNLANDVINDSFGNPPNIPKNKIDF